MAVEARKWERGVAGSCNVVHFDGSDIVGVAHFCREDEANLACDLTAQLAAVTAERDELREWMASAVPEIRSLYKQLRYTQRQDPNEFTGTVKEVLDRAAAIINSPEGREEEA